jgi:hypothetical protein
MAHLLHVARANLWIPILAAVVWCVVRACKTDRLVERIPLYIARENRALGAIGLGLIGAGLDRLVECGTWYDAIAGGVVAGSLAIAAHEIIVVRWRGGRELGEKKAAPPASVWEDDSPPSSKPIALSPRSSTVAFLGALALGGGVVFGTACPGALSGLTNCDRAVVGGTVILIAREPRLELAGGGAPITDGGGE